MEELLRNAADRAIGYLQGLPERRVAPDEDALARLARFDEPLPEGPDDPQRVIGLLDEIGSPATMASAGPRFFGFVIGGSQPVAVAAQWLATAWDQNAGAAVASPVAAALEGVVRGWLVDLFGLPATTAVGFATGATMANMSAIAAARHAVLQRVGYDVDEDGLAGAPEITMVVGDETHPSVIKGLGLLGLGRRRVRRVPTDDQGRLRADALPQIDGPTIVCAQAGNVNTGAFDPSPRSCEWGHAGGAWVHVDGAFGLWAAAAPAHAHLVRGFAGADSWATDAHKWLNVPYDSGLAFVRDPEPLRAAMGVTAAYLPKSMMREASSGTPELLATGARRRGLGRPAFARPLRPRRPRRARLPPRRTVRRRPARRRLRGAQRRRAEPGARLVRGPERDAPRHRRHPGGRHVLGGVTEWQGHTAMRISVSSWQTTDDDVERSLEAMIAAAKS